VRAFDSERFRQPMLLTLLNYTVNAAVVIVSALLSSLLLWHRLGRLDLVAVLKTRE
jgi:putative ABC transport system permease protein